MLVALSRADNGRTTDTSLARAQLTVDSLAASAHRDDEERAAVIVTESATASVSRPARPLLVPNDLSYLHFATYSKRAIGS
jgi:hypothetical protein